MKLEVNHLTCGYGGRTVVKDVSFDLMDGDVCCILGQNGVGKSTLFKSILRLIPPLGGSVYLDGSDIGKWSRSRLADAIAYVSQSHQAAFPSLVEDMVMLGRMNKIGAFGTPGKEDHAVVDRVLSDLEIASLREKPFSEISGGERQMVLIARALAQEAKILVLDEPTANLDYGNKVHVLKTLKSLAEGGICSIFTTHDPEQALLLDCKTLLITTGQQVIFGAAETVVTERNLMLAYNAPIRVVEILDENRGPVRVCLPVV